MQQYV